MHVLLVLGHIFPFNHALQHQFQKLGSEETTDFPVPAGGAARSKRSRAPPEPICAPRSFPHMSLPGRSREIPVLMEASTQCKPKPALAAADQQQCAKPTGVCEMFRLPASPA